jgi:hypothetical protein
MAVKVYGLSASGSQCPLPMLSVPIEVKYMFFLAVTAQFSVLPIQGQISILSVSLFSY